MRFITAFLAIPAVMVCGDVGGLRSIKQRGLERNEEEKMEKNVEAKTEGGLTVKDLGYNTYELWFRWDHDSLKATGSGDKITFKFWSHYWDGCKDDKKTCDAAGGCYCEVDAVEGYLSGADDGWIGTETKRKVQRVTVETDGDDALFLDWLELWKVKYATGIGGYNDDALAKDHLERKWGKENGRGWCLSTDSSDAFGSAASACYDKIAFDKTESDAHAGCSNCTYNQLFNKIDLVSFEMDLYIDGMSKYYGTNNKVCLYVFEKCSSQDDGSTNQASFLHGNQEYCQLNENCIPLTGLGSTKHKKQSLPLKYADATAFVVETDGDDAMAIDAVYFERYNKKYQWGVNGGKGWCLSTDPNDTFKGGYVGGDGKCDSKILFDISYSRSNGCDGCDLANLFKGSWTNDPPVTFEMDLYIDGMSKYYGTNNKVCLYVFEKCSSQVARDSFQRTYLHGTQNYCQLNQNCIPLTGLGSTKHKKQSLPLAYSDATTFVVETDGDDAMAIDAVYVKKNNKKYQWGVNGGKGWCLSTDPKDTFKGGYIGGDGKCDSMILFDIEQKRSKGCDKALESCSLTSIFKSNWN